MNVRPISALLALRRLLGGPSNLLQNPEEAHNIKKWTTSIFESIRELNNMFSHFEDCNS